MVESYHCHNGESDKTLSRSLSQMLNFAFNNKRGSKTDSTLYTSRIQERQSDKATFHIFVSFSKLTKAAIVV